MAVEVQVDTRRLTALISDLEPAKIQQLLNRAGFEAEGLAKQAAPVDTGFLRSRIGTKPGPQEVTVGASAKYAPYVELGTRHMRAQPYLGPAVEKAVANLVAALERMFSPREVHVGSRGGVYTYSNSGRKVYQRRGR